MSKIHEVSGANQERIFFVQLIKDIWLCMMMCAHILLSVSTQFRT
jgi:hypothetical protein